MLLNVTINISIPAPVMEYMYFVTRLRNSHPPQASSSISIQHLKCLAAMCILGNVIRSNNI